MSLRKMLRVSLLMLLAMTLAATGGHARLDLFGLRTSHNQPNPTNSGGEWIPYLECIQTCDHCVCDKRVPELAMCICADQKPLHNSAEKVQVQAAEELSRELDMVSKPVDKLQEGAMPYPECKKQCDACVACTKIYPIELAWCVCENKTDSNSKKAAIQNSGGDKQLVLWTDAKLDPMSYDECISTCEGTCACTLPWPQERAICVCMSSIKREASSKVLPAAQEVAKVKSKVLPYEECQKSCKHVCACTLIWPPEASVCVCGDDDDDDSIKSSTAKAAGKLHKELDVVVKPLSKSVRGFLPYPECIKQCDECVICTKNWPMEKVLCYCGQNTDTNSKISAIPNSGDDKKLVLWTKTKLDSISYKECTETCGECACTKPLTPVSPAACICLYPKAAGRALSI